MHEFSLTSFFSSQNLTFPQKSLGNSVENISKFRRIVPIPLPLATNAMVSIFVNKTWKISIFHFVSFLMASFTTFINCWKILYRKWCQTDKRNNKKKESTTNDPTTYFDFFDILEYLCDDFFLTMLCKFNSHSWKEMTSPINLATFFSLHIIFLIFYHKHTRRVCCMYEKKFTQNQLTSIFRYVHWWNMCLHILFQHLHLLFTISHPVSWRNLSSHFVSSTWEKSVERKKKWRYLEYGVENKEDKVLIVKGFSG